MSHPHQQLLQCKLILTPDVPWWDYPTHHHTTTLRSWGQLCTNNHITIISIGSHAELWITTAHYAFQQMPCLISCVSVTERYGEGLLYILCKKGMGLCVYDGAASSTLKQLACKNHCNEWLQCITCHQRPNSLTPRLLGGSLEPRLSVLDFVSQLWRKIRFFDLMTSMFIWLVVVWWILSQSFGDFSSKVVRQNVEKKAWVWG